MHIDFIILRMIDRGSWYSKSDSAMFLTGCCIDANVSSSCLPVCHLNSMPTDLNVLTACASDINKVLKCGTGMCHKHLTLITTYNNCTYMIEYSGA